MLTDKKIFPTSLKASLAAVAIVTTPPAFSFHASDLLHGHVTTQLGYYWSSQGEAQNINIADLIGDRFTVTDGNDSSGLFGVGYYIDGQKKGPFNMSYGLNFFYLAPTGVTGNVIQEQLFTNLSYSYRVTHYPLYVMAKSTFDTNSPKYGITLDAGIGPNFISTSNFQEHSLDAITLPDHIFSGKNTTTFSATAGIGLKINQFFGQAPLECGYRFFYLGEGSFNKLSNQVLNTLGTGSNFGNAVTCAVTI